MKKNQNIQILLLEDDVLLAELVEEFLLDCGYSITLCHNGSDVLERVYEQSYDILLLDVKVPAKSGFDVLDELRKQGNATPAIFMTSLSAIEDLSTAYTIGCDDYLRKPFELKELELRILALIKRHFAHKSKDNLIEITNEISFDIINSKIISDTFETILPKKEAQILKLLLSKRGFTASTSELFSIAWKFDEEYSEESLRTHIKVLRKLIGKDMIVNIRGQGYMLA